jgi:predicted nuclease of predicted toxin-antitoxin system
MATTSPPSLSAALILETRRSWAGLAAAEARIIVTIDADFGTLVFRDGATRVGVLRLRQRAPQAMAARASELVSRHADDLEQKAFVTDDGEKARISRTTS